MDTKKTSRTKPGLTGADFSLESPEAWGENPKAENERCRSHSNCHGSKSTLEEGKSIWEEFAGWITASKPDRENFAPLITDDYY